MEALSTLLMIYMAGVIGSMIGGVSLDKPKTWAQWDYIVITALFWPKHLYILYQNTLEKRAHEIAEDNIANLENQLRQMNHIIALLTRKGFEQEAHYHKLSLAYAKLKDDCEKELKKELSELTNSSEKVINLEEVKRE